MTRQDNSTTAALALEMLGEKKRCFRYDFKEEREKERVRDTFIEFCEDKHYRLRPQMFYSVIKLLRGYKPFKPFFVEYSNSKGSDEEDTFSYSPSYRYGFRFVPYKGKELRAMYDPKNDNFSPDEYPFDDITDDLERDDFEAWAYENALEAWGKYLRDEVPRAISELKELSSRVMDERGRHAHALKRLEGIKKQGYEYYEVEYIQQAKDLLDDMQTWVNELKAKIRTEIKTLESGAVFLVSRSFLSAPRTSSRSRRSPVRSAAKAGDDGGGDGDSDGPGDPPGPKLTVPSSHNFHVAIQLNSLPRSRTVHPCHWCMDWRWAA